MKHNDAANDIGIATVLSFASPANKLSTVPLSRFTTMIKRGFPDMLNHNSARYDSMEIDADTAIQAVWLMTPAGAEVGYAFQLNRQVDADNAGMGMTDMVIPLGEGPGSRTRIQTVLALSRISCESGNTRNTFCLLNSIVQQASYSHRPHAARDGCDGTGHLRC